MAVLTSSQDGFTIFFNHCIFIRSLYEHSRILFVLTTDKERALMERTANVFFGDLSHVLAETVILQVCKITDPAKDNRGNENFTVAHFLLNANFAADLDQEKRLNELHAQIQEFRKKLKPARDKLISHSDLAAVMKGAELGAATEDEWGKFWSDLEKLLCILHEQAFGSPTHLNEVALLSDADNLIKALKQAKCFDKLMRENDPALSRKCIQVWDEES
jgi:hypothetical protein